MQRKQIEVWVCPTPECSNYYGSSTSIGRNLREAANHRDSMRNTDYRLPDPDEDKKDESGRVVTGYRSECPDCKELGRGLVHRVKAFATVVIPTPDELKAIVAPDNSDAT